MCDLSSVRSSVQPKPNFFFLSSERYFPLTFLKHLSVFILLYYYYYFSFLNQMMSKRELRAVFLFEFKLGDNAATATKKINTAFGEGSVNERTVQIWFKKFRSGKFDLENEPRGRPKTIVDDDELKSRVESNPNTNVRKLASDMGISASTVSRHLKSIQKVKKLDKWVPRKFKSGKRKLQDAPKLGRSSNIGNNTLKPLNESNPRRTIKKSSSSKSKRHNKVSKMGI